MAENELPVIIPNKLLISPGIWNDNEYSAEELSEAFTKTDWNDKSKISLWLNHDDRNTAAFVGYVKNPTLASKGRVFGDLEIWDEKIATSLTKAMAKFGVSAKIKGEEDKKGKMHNFTFENFSIVTIPACSDAYINLSKKEEEEEKTTSKYLYEKEKQNYQSYPKKEIEEESSYTNERGLKDMEERLQEEDKDKKKKEMPEEDEEDKEKEKENSQELSEKDMLKELSTKFDKLIEVLSKKELQEEEATSEEGGESEEGEQSSEEPAPIEVSEDNKELELVKKELALIKEKLNAPKSKTVRNLSSNSVGNEMKYNENTFCDFLTQVDRPVKFN
jgi:hypothetical protein